VNLAYLCSVRIIEAFRCALTRHPEAARLRVMDDPSIIQAIYELAAIAAAEQVKPEHWAGELPDFIAAPAPKPS